MQIGYVGPSMPALLSLDPYAYNPGIWSDLDACASYLSPTTEAGKVYFRVGKEVVYWCPKTRVFEALHGHALPVISIAAGTGCIYSADRGCILCWDSSTHAKLAEIYIKNIAHIWVCGDILIVVGIRAIQSYKLSGNSLSLLHEIPLAPQTTLGTIVSAGVVQNDISYSYFLVMQRQTERGADNYIYTWTAKKRCTPPTSNPCSEIVINDVFPQFTEHVEQTGLPLLTDSEIASIRAKHMQNLAAQTAYMPCTQSGSTLQVLDDKTLSVSSKQLPGTRGHIVLTVRALASNHILCVCKDMLCLYSFGWSILSRKDLLEDTVLASYVHVTNNYVVLGHISGWVSIYDCASLALVTALDLRQSASVNGDILAVALLEVDGYPNIFVVFKRGAAFLGDIISCSIVPCLGLCMSPSLIIPFRGLCLAAPSNTEASIVTFQSVFNPEIHAHVSRSFVLESSFHSPYIDFVVDLYYQHYAVLVTDSHIILLESVPQRQNDLRFSESPVEFTQIRQCASKMLAFESSTYQSGCFVAGPLMALREDSSQKTLAIHHEGAMQLWLCLLTDQALHLFSVPSLDSLAVYTFSSSKCLCTTLTSFLACDRGAAHGDYLLLSARHQRSVSVFTTATALPYIRLCGVYPLASISLSYTAIHPSSMYALTVHSTGIVLYTLPDFTLVSTSTYKRSSEDEHTIYFDPMGAYFLVSTISHKYGTSTLTIYEFGTGSVHSSLSFDGKIKQVIFTNDIHAFLSDDKGNIYELLYDDSMISVISDMEQHIGDLNNSVTQLWAAMEDVKWD